MFGYFDSIMNPDLKISMGYKPSISRNFIITKPILFQFYPRANTHLCNMAYLILPKGSSSKNVRRRCYDIYILILHLNFILETFADLLPRGVLRSFSISSENVVTLKIYYQAESRLKMVSWQAMLCKVNKSLAYSKLARYKESQKRFRLWLETPRDLDIKELMEIFSLSGFAKITFFAL